MERVTVTIHIPVNWQARYPRRSSPFLQFGSQGSKKKLSKFVRFAPTTTEVSSVDAAHIFADRVVSLFGLPKKLITDRDMRFTSNMFTNFADSLAFRMPSPLPCTYSHRACWLPDGKGLLQKNSYFPIQ